MVQVRPYARSPSTVGIRYDRYRKITLTDVIVEYTGVYSVKAIASMHVSQIAVTGTCRVGLTCRIFVENGSPPSRANANITRDADVTVASPHRYCAIAMPTNNSAANAGGSTELMVHTTTRSPCCAAVSRSGIASTMAHSMTQPKIPDTSTERRMPRGALYSALTVSSAVCADASKPVMV